jgi:membrane-associated phospholipid phosphatase
VVFGVVYPLYDASRWVLAGRFPTASAHARWVIALERSMGFAFERSVQRVFEAGPAEWLLSNVYLAAQLVVLPGSLIWLYRRSPRVYRRLRDTVVAAWLMAVPIFALFPVAPPRLAGVGMLDTVSHHAAVALTGRSTIFYNPYAAVPSLHVGLAFAIGIAARATFRARWARALALMWGPLVAVSVVATGSHYVFDVAAGLVVTGLAHAAARLTRRRPLLRRRGQLHRLRPGPGDEVMSVTPPWPVDAASAAADGAAGAAQRTTVAAVAVEAGDVEARLPGVVAEIAVSVTATRREVPKPRPGAGTAGRPWHP